MRIGGGSWNDEAAIGVHERYSEFMIEDMENESQKRFLHDERIPLSTEMERRVNGRNGYV